MYKYIILHTIICCLVRTQHFMTEPQDFSSLYMYIKLIDSIYLKFLARWEQFYLMCFETTCTNITVTKG